MVGAQQAAAARRTQGVLVALLAAVAVHSFCYKPGVDFQVFYTAAARALAGAPLYQPADVLPFKYLPPVAWLLTPLLLLPRAPARALWYALLVLCWSDLVRQRAALHPHGAGPRVRVALAVLATLTCTVQEFDLGQCDALLLWLMARSEADARTRPGRSGLSWALACLFKPPFLIFALCAAAAREWRRLAAAAAWGGLAALLSLWPRGPQAGLALWHWRALLAATTPAALSEADCQSLAGLVARYGAAPAHAPAAFRAQVLVLTLLLVAVGALAVHRSGGDADSRRARAGAGAFALTALLSPLGWIANFMALLPLCLVALERPQIWRRWGLAALAPLYVAEALNFETLGRARYTALLAHRHLGLAALACALLTAWSLTRAPRPWR